MPERSSLHWFPIYVTDWLSSPAVSMMLPEQEGAYFRLCALAWGDGDSEPSLPADAPTLAQMSRLGSRWRKLGPLVRAQFEERDGRLYNAKLSDVWREQQEKHTAAVTKGSKGGKTKAARAKLNPSSASSPASSSARAGAVAEGVAIESLEGAVEASAPYGAERLLPAPAPDGGLAPAGAAPPAPGAMFGTGNYLDRPSVRDELRKRTHVAPWEPGHAAAPTIGDVEAARVERRNAYESVFTLTANDWMDAHPAETKAIGREKRQHLGLPLTGEPTLMQTQVLREAVVEEIRRREGWASLEDWDGSDTLTPLSKATTQGAAA